MDRVAELEENPGGANHFVIVELGQLRGVGHRLRHRPRRRVVPELVRGELAVEGGHVIGPGGVPFCRELGFALRLGGASAPITGPRLGVGCRTRVNMREKCSKASAGCFI